MSRKWLFGVMMLVSTVHAQALYKYVDENGKVSYSDQPPKNGQKAERVETDSKANVVPAPTNTVKGKTQTLKDVNARAKARETKRDNLQAEVDYARIQVDRAKRALEEGREPREDERLIVVRAGGNSVMRTEAYAERIAGLERKVKEAEERLRKAEERYNTQAPD